MAVLVGAVLLLAIDGTVLYLAVPSLTADLEASATEVLWIGDIYSLALAGLLVTMGNVADRVGRKKLLLVGATAFGVASILAAISVSPEMLIAARLLLGITGATIMPSTLSLIRNIFTDTAERTRAIALWAAAASSGIALGPLVGGVLLEHFWWGSVFLINVPVIVLLVIAGVILLPESRNPDPQPFDLLSSVLSMVAIVPFVFLVKKVVGGELSVIVLCALIVSVVGAILFVRRQRTSKAPMIDVALFKNSEFTGAVVVNFITIFALSGLLFFFSQYLQLAREMSPLQAGLAQLPVSLAAMSVVFVVGTSLRWLGRGRAISSALAVGAVGLGLLSFAESANSFFWIALALVPVGLGIGLAETLSVDAVVTAVKPEKAGAAASISETAYELGVALGIAVLGSIVTALYRSDLIFPDELSADVRSTAEDSLASAAQVLERGSANYHAAQDAFVSGMQITTIVAAGILVLSAVVAWRVIPSDRSTKPVEH
ncbi:MFS transporter [Rhodococcoides kroppenstedtii]|uniref:MFS transporter n=1 Tax=Rhodococcoides kroppenstedtii TaxID=293050 RepID=UPI0028E9D8A1|nr:MFS transporter [Rhodococcus kroppenstedtii]